MVTRLAVETTGFWTIINPCELAKTKAALDEMNLTIARNRFGYADSEYLRNWLAIQVLLPEAEQLLAAGEKL